jgi:hypothetical protein
MGPYGQSAGGVLQRVVAGDGTRSLSTNAVVIAPTKIVCKFPTARNSGGLAASVISSVIVLGKSEICGKRAKALAKRLHL